MNVSDELLMAYVDGELDAAQRAAVEHAIAADPQLAGRVRHHQALRRQVRGAFDPVLSEPVPDRLLAVLRKQPPSSAAGDKVVAFRQRAPQLAMVDQRARWSWPQWSAIAASWVAGVVMAVVAINLTRDELTAVHNGSLVARGALAAALTSQPSGTVVASIRMQLGFKNRSGEYCRSFVIQQQALAGLACRQGNDDWHVPVLAAVNGEHGTYRQAGSELPPAVAQWIDTERDGEVLDANAEQAALRTGWRKR